CPALWPCQRHDPGEIPGMKVLVCGGRDFNRKRELFSLLSMIHTHYFSITMIVEGEASGADTIAKEWAEYNGIAVDAHPADWKNIDVPSAVVKQGKYGPYNAAAGHQRNAKMLAANPDICIA